MPVDNMPIPCSLNADGGNDAPDGYVHPVLRVVQTEIGALVDVQENHNFKCKKVPSWLIDLMYQFEEIRASAISKAWLHELLTQMVSCVVATVNPAPSVPPGQPRALTFPDLVTVAVWPKRSGADQVPREVETGCVVLEVVAWSCVSAEAVEDAGAGDDPLPA